MILCSYQWLIVYHAPTHDEKMHCRSYNADTSNTGFINELEWAHHVAIFLQWYLIIDHHHLLYPLVILLIFIMLLGSHIAIYHWYDGFFSAIPFNMTDGYITNIEDCVAWCVMLTYDPLEVSLKNIHSQLQVLFTFYIQSFLFRWGLSHGFVSGGTW